MALVCAPVQSSEFPVPAVVRHLMVEFAICAALALVTAFAAIVVPSAPATVVTSPVNAGNCAACSVPLTPVAKAICAHAGLLLDPVLDRYRVALVSLVKAVRVFAAEAYSVSPCANVGMFAPAVVAHVAHVACPVVAEIARGDAALAANVPDVFGNVKIGDPATACAVTVTVPLVMPLALNVPVEVPATPTVTLFLAARTPAPGAVMLDPTVKPFALPHQHPISAPPIPAVHKKVDMSDDV